MNPIVQLHRSDEVFRLVFSADSFSKMNFFNFSCQTFVFCAKNRYDKNPWFDMAEEKSPNFIHMLLVG